MARKIKVLVSEQEFADMIAKTFLGGQDKIVKDILSLFKSDEEKKDSSTTTSSDVKVQPTSGEFAQLDLNKPEDYKAYQEIADKFISSRSSNLLGIRGSMLADAAKNAQNNFGKYVPVELSLGQLAAEGGFSKDPNSRPIRTKNPYNVGNVDSGKNEFHSSVQSGIQKYYDLIAKNYLTDNKTASDLLNNFVNKNGNRYASGKEYEQMVSKISSEVQKIAQPVYASLNKKSDTSLT